MLKKRIKYTNLDGEPKEKDFYFHLNMAELAEMQVTTQGGLGEYLRSVLARNDSKELLATFKDIIRSSVGERVNEDEFVKSPEITARFMNSNAYSELVMEMFTNPKMAAEFIEALLPKELIERAKAKMDIETAALLSGEATDEQIEKAVSASAKKFEDYTRDELYAMPDEKFDALLDPNHKNWTKQQRAIAMGRLSRSE